MPQTKTRTKIAKKAPVSRPEVHLEVPEEGAENAENSFLIKKVKVEVELDEEALPVPEKLEELSPFGDAAAEEDSGDEEVGLDDEEINPFGDKWEV